MKSGIYYKKDKKCRPIKKTAGGGGVFDPTTYRYMTPAPIWCYASQLSQSQIFEAKQYGEDETRLFVLNYRDDIEVYTIIEYESKYYTVTRVDTKDDYKTELFVYAQDTPPGDTPTNILPYSAN